MILPFFRTGLELLNCLLAVTAVEKSVTGLILFFSLSKNDFLPRVHFLVSKCGDLLSIYLFVYCSVFIMNRTQFLLFLQIPFWTFSSLMSQCSLFHLFGFQVLV